MTKNKFLAEVKKIGAKRQNITGKGLVETGSSNWLMVRKESNGAVISIPKYCRVQDISMTGQGGQKRENFTIVDWPYENEKCSVSALPDSRSRFADVQYNKGATCVFDNKTKTLIVNPGNIKVFAGIDPNTPLRNGYYELFLPDAPHKHGNSYLDRTSFALTWFFINDNDTVNRYLHTGSLSLGCVTVGVNGTDSDIRRWTDIATVLSVQRHKNKFVGVLEIKNV